MTAPNGPSQQRVIRAALANARLTTSDVDVVEAHGTGTTLGDPIEAQALLATYGQDREEPLYLGSIKSNIGHAQAAAGIAGVLKVVQALRHGVLPKTLHADERSPEVDWDAGAVELLTGARDWPAVDRPRRAAVSSFGISGTNAHVIIEQAPEPEPVEAAGAPAVLPWVLSAGSADALRALARSVEGDPLAVGLALATSRSVLDHRAVVLAEHGSGLAALAGDRPSPTVVAGVAEGPGKPVFVFPGQGAQWVGMGRELLAVPAFADRMAQCADALRAFVDWDLVSVLDDAAMLDRVDVVQPALWAVMVSLAELWKSYGVTPSAVVGHSQGEIAAAVVAGALSLEDGARVVALRSKVIAESLAGRGGMVSIALPADEVRERIAPWPGVGIAAVNGAGSVVVSGDDASLDAVIAALEAAEVRVRRVPVDYASHSTQVADLEDELLRALAPVEPRAARTPLISTVTGAPFDTTGMDAAYWYRNLRQTVLFDQAVSTLAGAVLVEVSPHPVLVSAMAGRAVGTLRREQGGLARVATSLAEAFVLGVAVDWSRWYAGATAPRADLPTYPFQRKHFWWEAGPKTARGADSRFWDLVSRGEAIEGVDADTVAVLARWRERELAEATADSWRYTVTWVPVPDPAPAALSGRWLVLADPAIAGAVRAAGAEVSTDQADGPFTGVVSQQGLTDTLALAQAGLDAPIWAVTTGAVSTGPGDPLTDPWQATVWGLGRVIGLEHPERWAGLVDLADTGERCLAHLVAALANPAEDQVAVRGSGTLVRRLARATSTGGPAWTPTGTAVVTGGTGALGSRVARWLVAAGADVLLLSRRGPLAPGAAELAAELGPAARIVACDITDRDALAAALDGAEVGSVFHTAAVLDDAVVDALTPEQVDTALAAKAGAAWHLHELLGDTVEAFVLFSSMAGVLGASGQANYAPGNAFLDALAQHRRGLGLPATAVAWGPWADGGMALGGVGDIARRHGVPELDPDTALRVLGGILGRDETAVFVADIQWDRFATAYTASRPSPLLADLPEVRALAPAAPPVTGLAARLAALPAGERLTAVTDVVRDQVAAILGHDSGAAIEARKPFKDLGFDSVTAVELRNALRRATDLALPATLVFDYPTPAVLAAHLLDELSGSTTASVVIEGGVSGEDEIAIVGMACRFPGSVESPDDLWAMLAEGRDGITGPPTDRGWPATAVRGGFLDDVTGFDAAFFGISPREALAMDPQQRLLLEVAWEAVERTGIDPTALRGSRTGVFAGTSGQDYTDLLKYVPDDLAGYVGTGTTASVLSGRVAYALGLEGPAVTVDTACSSSLVALHLAAQALRRGECSMALAGGVSVMSTPGLFGEFTAQGALSPDGLCRSFAKAADGTGFAEGIGVVVLQRLADARAEGRRVLAVVKGSAINSDGASNGLTAPNGPSQQRVIRAALADAGLAPSDVDAVEAHGTGTTLGDPIEAQALLATYGQDRTEPLWLGSVKSNIGHTQAAAGVAGVIKMVLALNHGALPSTLHVDGPSSQVDWTAGAIGLLTDNRDWSSADRPRRAGVSSFGISGTNAHLILEQAPETPAAERAPSGTVPWVLSSRTAAGLRAQADRLRAATGPDTDLAAVAAALLRTRARFEHRAVVAGADIETLHARLAEVEPGLPAREGSAPVFVFPGQGAQWVGMGRDLLSVPAFADRLAECSEALRPFVTWELVDVLGDEESLRRVDVVQPASWAVMVSLAALWKSYGVTPSAVIGHSQGEIAAAVVAGALSLEDGARVVALRSQAIAGKLAGLGGMASLALPVDQARELIAGKDLSLAAVNGPRSVVISGDTDGLDEVLERCAAAGVRARLIPVDYASHSAQVEILRAELLETLAPVAPRAPEVPIHSTVTGEPVTGPEMGAQYWVANLRGTVLFRHAVASVPGEPVFIEVSPHPVVSAAVSDTLADADRADTRTVGTLRRDDGGLDRFLRSAGEAHACGVTIDWSVEGPVADLPTYAWQHQRFWLDADTAPVVDERDSRFWSLVEGGGLADELGLPADEVRAVVPALTAWRRRHRETAEVDAWRYHAEWTTITPDGGATGDWLVVSPGSALATECATALGVPELTTDGTDLTAALSAAAPTGGVLLVPGGDTALALAVVQALGAAGVAAPLWVATRGAVADVTAPEQAAVWGLGRVVALEHPDRWGGLVDLEPGFDPALLTSVLGGTEDQVALRGGRALARRLAHAPAAPTADWTPRGTVLITGGTGALAGHVARWAAGAGAERVVLLSRRGPDAPGAADLPGEVVACDVSDAAAVKAVVDGLPDLTAVVHTAAVLDDGVVAALTPDRLATVFGPKADAARALHEATADRDLDAFVLFSSIAGALGNAGQANYAAANAYLDALAEHRRGSGLPGTSIAWGLWGGPSRADEAGERLRRGGVRPMDPATAVRALRAAVGTGDPVTLVADVDWPGLAAGFTATRPSPLLAALPELRSVSTQDTGDFAAELARLSGPQRDRAALGLVRKHVAAVLGHAGADAVEADKPFKDLGFDSLTAVDLRNRLAAATGLRLAATLVFDRPTPRALAEDLLARTAPVAADLPDDPAVLLAGLERGLAGADEATWAGIADRLRALLDKAPVDTTTPLDAASDDEMFAFIGKEFGIS
nr:type I polyketide synthase [Actinokineospora pegani]